LLCPSPPIPRRLTAPVLLSFNKKLSKYLLTSYTIKLYNYNMEDRRIVWEEEKNEDNKRKRGIGFETARFVFSDPNRLWRFDRSEGNTSGEERWQTLGMAEGVVFVVYTERELAGTNETRIITARLVFCKIQIS
jgi:uncharacterized DUF497 family protein